MAEVPGHCTNRPTVNCFGSFLPPTRHQLAPFIPSSPESVPTEYGRAFLIMLSRIGTIAIVQGRRRYQTRGIYAFTSVSVAIGGSFGYATQCQQPQFRQPWGNDADLLVPTIEASARVLRLIRTAVLMVLDYEVAKYKPRMLGSPSDEVMELEALEAEVEAKRNELEIAQLAYAIQRKDSNLPPAERRTQKENQKRRMIQAATDLAEIEEKIASEERDTPKSQLHRRAANRLLDLCRQNGGVYIKVGQHLANLDYLIPQEYTEVLSALFDDTPRSTYDDVCAVIEEDLGGKVDDIFDRFEKTPIASASLAQVHVAYDKKTGKKLAVKVQHRGLRETSVGDLFAVTKIVGLIDRWFEEFTFGWIADEIVPHLPKELDFTREGKNSEKAACHIAKAGLRCVIPKVIWTKTAPRVLTMEFEEGFKVTDETAIEKSGLNKQYVSQRVATWATSCSSELIV
jgi:ABC1 atypical kinase-like domain